MPVYLFYLFAALAVAGAVMVVCFRNPVASALAIVASFAGVAALFVGLDAFFVGIIQILVYAGAIMVLFIFIIMLLDLKTAEKTRPKILPVAAGVAIAVVLMIQLAGVLGPAAESAFPALDLAQGADEFAEGSKISIALAPTDPDRAASLPDVHLVGHTLFHRYNMELQIIGVLLLVATVGVVVLSRKQETGEDARVTSSEKQVAREKKS